MEAIWNANPGVESMFCFEDGNCFISKYDAAAHAKATQTPYKVVTRPAESTEVETKTKKQK